MKTSTDISLDEIWEDISGFEGKYQISHAGSVRRVKTKGYLVLKREHHYGGKAVPVVYRYYLSINGKSYKFTDKFLMAMTFAGPRPSADHNAALKDPGQPLSPSNVEWRHKRFSSMDSKLMCPNGHLMMTERDYYPRVYERTGHKRCRICHRGHVHDYEKRQLALKRKTVDSRIG
jgi:hypothetical protein